MYILESSTYHKPTIKTYFSTDYTYSNLKRLIKDESIVVIPGDKDSALVIMDKNDYVKKMQEMIDEGIQDGVYAKTETTPYKTFRTSCIETLVNTKNIRICYQVQTNLHSYTEQLKPINLII